MWRGAGSASLCTEILLSCAMLLLANDSKLSIYHISPRTVKLYRGPLVLDSGLRVHLFEFHELLQSCHDRRNESE